MNGPPEADVCVVGCGPAGLTVSRELVGAGLRVVAVDSGHLDESPAAQNLLHGRATGPVIKDYPTYLSDSRRSQVGGAGAGWGHVGRAWCMSFDPVDFEQRAWVDGSGWPFTAADLAPFAARAAATMGIHPFEETSAHLLSRRSRRTPSSTPSSARP